METTKSEQENVYKSLFIKFIEEHQTIASVLTIIISIVAINTYQMSDIRQDIKETNKRIDGLFQYVLTGKVINHDKK